MENKKQIQTHLRCPQENNKSWITAKTIKTYREPIHCSIIWIWVTSPWIKFYLQRAHTPVFLYFHLWQKLAPLQSSAPRRKENWIQRHWKKNNLHKFLFFKKKMSILWLTVKPMISSYSISREQDLADSKNTFIFQQYFCCLKFLECSSPGKFSVRVRLKYKHSTLQLAWKVL